MTKTIKSFFASIRQKLFTAVIEWEIYHRIFPHLNKHVAHGYSFDTKDEMVASHIRGNLTAQRSLDLIERTAGKMPKAYGDAFRYIAYRDLNQRMKMYVELAEQRVHQENSNPCFVATHA